MKKRSRKRSKKYSRKRSKKYSRNKRSKSKALRANSPFKIRYKNRNKKYLGGDIYEFNCDCCKNSTIEDC